MDYEMETQIGYQMKSISTCKYLHIKIIKRL